MENAKDIVRQGYDQLGDRYRLHYDGADNERYCAWLNRLAQILPDSSRVLELGCADGLPVASFLHQRLDYLGVDISPLQIERAYINVPGGHFKVADMASLVFPHQSFNAIVA